MSHVSDFSPHPLSDDLHTAAAVLPGRGAELLPARLLGDQSPLGTVVVPQATEHLAGDHLSHVHSDQSHDEHAVASQVVLGELGQDARLALRRVERAQLLADVLHLPGPVERPKQPREEVDEADQRQTDVPEPDEQEDLLVEDVDGRPVEGENCAARRATKAGAFPDVAGTSQEANYKVKKILEQQADVRSPDPDLLVEEVDGEGALDDVVVQSRLAPDRKFAERDARKSLRLRPVLAAQQALDDVGAVQVIVVDEQSVEQEQLADGVDHVHRLDYQVRGDQVVAVQLAADDAADFRDEVLNAHAAASSVVALRQQVAVHLVDDVADRLFADLEVARLGADVGGVHQRAEVDSRSTVEEAPHLARHVR